MHERFGEGWRAAIYVGSGLREDFGGGTPYQDGMFEVSLSPGMSNPATAALFAIVLVVVLAAVGAAVRATPREVVRCLEPFVFLFFCGQYSE